MKNLELRRSTALSPQVLGDQARRAAEEILIEGEAANTRQSYASALRYWCAWFAARYGGTIPLPVPVPVVLQFLVDHVARQRAGGLVCELPKAIDAKLVAAGAKGASGPLAMNTVRHRLAVLSKLHGLKRLKPNPCEDPAVAHLLAQARRAAAKRGEVAQKKAALTRDPLLAMLGTCDESLKGLRDRALLLFGWSSGGRRRSEIAGALMANLKRIDASTYTYRLGVSKSDQAGAGSDAADKPIVDDAAKALERWLQAGGITEGPIFRRLWKGRVGGALMPAAVRRIVQERARAAGLDGEWSAHSLRSGFVTESGRQGIPVGDVMAMTNHRHFGSMIGYYRSGEMTRAKAARLLAPNLEPAPSTK